MADVLTEEEWRTVGVDESGNLVPFAEEQIDRLVASLALHRPPRRFTLCGVRRDDEGAARDVAVLGWGLELDSDDEPGSDNALCYLPPLTAHHTPRFAMFSSAERARAMFARQGDVRLFWHDTI
jgi:alkanesulfonate monooxygenase SsuD/methylene tetrahydromethanopterin reductase-like flavin-dependent oxidoreductase (luciferase family)